jgi:RNA polymerase sigma-70 factor (ECF subfamily)
MYTPCHQAFLRYCRGLTGNRDDALDLAGESVLVVFENLERLRKKDSFKTYLFSVARRLRLQYYRRLRFRGVYDEKVAELLPDQNSLPDTMHDVTLLNDLLSKLPDKQREAIVLFELSGFSIEEIRELQGGTVSGVKMRLKRGRNQLRLWLEDPLEGNGQEGRRAKSKVKSEEVKNEK